MIYAHGYYNKLTITDEAQMKPILFETSYEKKVIIHRTNAFNISVCIISQGCNAIVKSIHTNIPHKYLLTSGVNWMNSWFYAEQHSEEFDLRHSLNYQLRVTKHITSQIMPQTNYDDKFYLPG